MEAAAKNPGGAAGGGLGLGAGFAMGQQMASQMGGNASPGAANTQHAQSMPAAPPPLPQETQYFVAVDGKQTGPFDLSALREKASAGQLTRRTLVWKSGLTEWKPAEAVAELGPVFAEVPPPLPKNG
jgi:hypothetical protein